MKIDIHNELQGLRITATIGTTNVEAHSALTEVPKDILDKFRDRVWLELHDLLVEANDRRKDLG